MTKASSPVVSPAAATAPHNGFSLISNEKLLALYSTMLKSRLLAARIATAASGKDPKAAAGSEAPIAGMCIDLLPGDTLAPGQRGFAASFIKGLPLSAILAPRPRFRYAALNLVPPALSLAAQLERALEAAKTNKASRNKKLVVAFCGESSVAPDLLHQVMRQAAKRKLALLLVANSDADDESLSNKAKDCDLPVMTVDGADAVALYRVATESMAHARRGSGPTFVDCKPWIYAGQTAAERKKSADSIYRMEEYLTRKGLFDKKLKASVTAQFRKELDAALLFKGLA